MRELQLWQAGDGLRLTFDDIESLAKGCRFRDCRHLTEPRCAVWGAVAEGELDSRHVQSYHKLSREIARLARKTDEVASLMEKKKLKRIFRYYNRHTRK